MFFSSYRSLVAFTSPALIDFSLLKEVRDFCYFHYSSKHSHRSSSGGTRWNKEPPWFKLDELLYLVLRWFINSKEESVFNRTKLTLPEGSQAVGKVILGCAARRTKRYHLESEFVPPSAACFVGSRSIYVVFIQRMKLAALYWIRLGQLPSQPASPGKHNCTKGKKECIYQKLRFHMEGKINEANYNVQMFYYDLCNGLLQRRLTVLVFML